MKVINMNMGYKRISPRKLQFTQQIRKRKLACTFRVKIKHNANIIVVRVCMQFKSFRDISMYFNH